MGLTEFAFKVSADTNYLCSLTKKERGIRVLVNLLRASPESEVRESTYTFLGITPELRPVLDDGFLVEYPETRLLTESPGAATFVVKSRLLPAHGGVDPLAALVQTVGRDAFFGPILIEDGYIHVTIVSPSETARERFLEFSETMRSHMGAHDFKLLHIGSYDPGRGLAPQDGALTPRQEEVVRMAIALGYYDEPRGCRLDDLAKAFGVSKAAVHKRLLTAESKIIKGYHRQA